MSNIGIDILIGFAFSLFIILLKYFILLLILLFSWKIEKIINFLEIKDDLINLFALTIIFSISIFLFNHFNLSADKYLIILSSVTFAAIPISYAFFLQPLVYLVNSKNYVRLEEYEKWVEINNNQKIHLRIINKKIINAFATGIIPYLKIILLGKSVIEKFNEEEIKCLLLHEIGHLKKNHLRKLYFANLTVLLFYVITNFELLPFFKKQQNPGLFIAIYAGIVIGAGTQIFSGFIQKKLEKEADFYAASKSPKGEYRKMLLKLNEITDKALEKWSFNYPKLNERLENIKDL